mgnify:CR=1 FL=1
MPTYRFQCSACGLSFTARAAVNAPEAPCAACKTAAPRDLPQGTRTGHAAAANPTGSNPAPGATGYAGVDYNYDRAIGEDARAKWAILAARQREKLGYLEATGATGFDLSRMPDGTYRVMAPTERGAKTAVRKQAFATLAEEKAAREKEAPPAAANLNPKPAGGSGR